MRYKRFSCFSSGEFNVHSSLYSSRHCFCGKSLGQRTKEYMLNYQKSEGLEIIGYFDSDFAGCQDNKCSTSRYIYMLAGGAISWKFVKQTLIAPSTMVVELWLALRHPTMRYDCKTFSLVYRWSMVLKDH
ncbi:hypothetical protein CR513_40712, partial [Mucuna pruriens]